MAEYLTFEEVAATLKCSMGKVRQYVLEDRQLVATRLTMLGMASKPTSTRKGLAYDLDFNSHVGEDGTITVDSLFADGRPSVTNIPVGYLRIERAALDAFKLQRGIDLYASIFDADSADYPELLHIAVHAWEHAKNTDGETPKKRILAFLNARYLGLHKSTKESIALVANWQKSGGRPKTGG